MIYGFINDKSMHNRFDKLTDESDINQGCGYFGEKAREYYDEPSLFSDTRVQRLTILDQVITNPMELYLDKTLSKELVDIGTSDTSKLFNIMELCYLSQHKNVDALDAVMKNNNLLYGIYVPNSLILSASTSTLNIYTDSTTLVQDVIIRDAINFEIKIVGVTIGFTIWLNQTTFLANYPISTIKTIVHSMDPNTYLTLDYDSIIDALQKSSAYMYKEIHEAMTQHENTDLNIFTTTYVPPGGEGCQLDFGILYKGHSPTHAQIRAAIIENLLSLGIASEENWKKIFPNLWISGIIYLIPSWDNSYIINPTYSIYKGSINVTKILKTLKTIHPNYTDDYISKNTEATRAICSQLYLGALQKYKDGESEMGISDIFPTYQVIDTTDPGFKYMSQKAQEFSILLNNAIAQLIGATNESTFPTVIEQGRKYLTFSSNGLEFYVLYKESFPIDVNDIIL